MLSAKEMGEWIEARRKEGWKSEHFHKQFAEWKNNSDKMADALTERDEIERQLEEANERYSGFRSTLLDLVTRNGG